MKPDKSYLSLYKGKGRTNKLLLLLLVAQTCLLILFRITIPVPLALTEELLGKYKTQNISFEVEQTTFTFPDEITVKKFVLLTNGHKTAVANDLKIQYPFLQLPWGEWKDLKEVKAKSFSLHAMGENQPRLQMEDLDFKRLGNGLHFMNAFIRADHSYLQVKGALDMEYIKSLFKTPPKKKQRFDLSESLDLALSYTKEARTALKETGSLHLQSFINCSLDKGEVHLSQLDEDGPPPPVSLRGLRATVQILKKDAQNHFASLQADLKDFSIKSGSFSTQFKNLSFSNQSIPFQHLNTLKRNWGESRVSIGETEFSGRIEGTLPSCGIVSNSTDGVEAGMFFSESNRTQIALGYQYDSILSLHGEALLVPKLFDLYCHTKKGRLRVIDGDESTLALFRNNDQNRNLGPMHFRFTTPRLSVMETPDGMFLLKGIIAPDYSISVDSAQAKLGQSEVTGTYFQSWFPHNFRFLLNGTFLPTDINNWFGSWWRSIWTDFGFDGEIPWGDFSISGEWGSSGSNTTTYGMVRTQKLSYNDFAISKSSALVETDFNQTTVRTSIWHPTGQLRGNLSFPRDRLPGGKLLSFDFNGDYPLNKGRKTFGPEVERYLNDINATNLLCEASGSIFESPKDTPGENNQTNYKIKISTDQNASFWTIPTQYLHGGEITYRNLVTSGKFRSIGLAKGMATLDFISEKQADNQALDFTFNLRGADRTALVSALSKANLLSPETQKHITENIHSTDESPGKIDLRIQAKGPFGKFLQFNGTGHVRLIEKSLQKVNLLGVISKKLDAIKLPIPSGSFSFEMVEIPFRLENDQVHSTNIVLSGPLSRLEAAGRLNLVSGELDVTARLKLIGNLKIPILKNIINLADPLAKITKIRISGDWKKPKTEFISSLDKILP